MYLVSSSVYFSEQLGITSKRKGTAMLFAEFPSGQRLDFDSPEALARAVQSIRAGTPIVVRDEKSGEREVVWAPGDEDCGPPSKGII